MTDEILIILMVLAVLILGCWYAVRVFRLARKDDTESLQLSEPETKTGMPVSYQVLPASKIPDEVINNFKGLSVIISADTAPAVAALGDAMKKMADLTSSLERVLDSTRWHWHKPYFEKRDMWLGVYWNYTADVDVFDIDGDELSIYICLIPCVVIKLTRTRIYKTVAKKENK